MGSATLRGAAKSGARSCGKDRPDGRKNVTAALAKIARMLTNNNTPRQPIQRLPQPEGLRSRKGSFKDGGGKLRSALEKRAGLYAGRMLVAEGVDFA